MLSAFLKLLERLWSASTLPLPVTIVRHDGCRRSKTIHTWTLDGISAGCNKGNQFLKNGIGLVIHQSLLFSNSHFWSFPQIRGAAMRHVLSALVHNQPGVLAHVSGMLASRGFNIESLAVGETEDANLSRMTFVVHGDDGTMEQVGKQLRKIVTVVKVQDISSEDFVERDLMLIKVSVSPAQRVEITLLVEMFRGKVVDVSNTSLIIEISGTEQKIIAFIDLMRPYGIIELARTGRIALVRGVSHQLES